MKIQDYYNELNEKIEEAYQIANEARSMGYDPLDHVEIPLTKNMAERVEGLISVVAPQIKNSGLVHRIEELEIKYGKLDWRVALVVSLGVAQEKFCKFASKKEAMEVGIRVGLAYLSNGVVSSPLEGFTELKIKKRRDGKEYFCLMFSGPIRSAGTTITCGSILVANYIRKEFGYSKYDPTEDEVKRAIVELYDYHEKVTNLQYLPSEEEIAFMIKNLPLQINGDPSEKWDVSNYKDLERIETNRLRNGFCLVVGEALCQKAAKFWGKLNKFYKDFELEDWLFLEDFLKLQKKIKAREIKEEDKTGQKLKPDFTYIKDLVAGRPVLTHPLSIGGFRLRYGRSRVSGLSSLSIHPATMHLLKNYIATGTQLRYERPGKSTAIALCDSIEGPIVKLKDQSVVFVETEEQAKEIKDEVEEILFLGDILINYGEFYNRAHFLIPAGYCEEWWLREFEKAIIDKYGKLDLSKIAIDLGIEEEFLLQLFKNPLTKINFDIAKEISLLYKVPLHSRYTYHWNDINKHQFLSLLNWLEKGKVKGNDIILPLIYEVNLDLKDVDAKRVLELIGLPHYIENKEVIIENDDAKALMFTLNDFDLKLDKENVLEILNDSCKAVIRDKSGTFIGARMGRPEKAKMRKLTGSPHVLFPVGDEGGKLRSFQSALEQGKVVAEFPIYYCENCNIDTIYPICETCNKETIKKFYCAKCDLMYNNNICKKHSELKPYSLKVLPINHFFETALKKIKLSQAPDLIKGVRGTSNEDHTPENLAKGVLRALHNLYVNKDGTIRYDMTEMPITAFKPKEIDTSITKLRELGYNQDIYGNPLLDREQLVEIMPSDVILPACKESPDEGADIVLLRMTNFIDDLLQNFYNLKPYYNAKTKEDLIGHLVIGLAPHTSAAIAGRIIGFSKTQGCFAHPMWHAAQRRDCFGYDTNIPIYDGISWENVKIGEFVENLKPDKVVDNFGTLAKDVSNYKTLAYNTKTNKIDTMPIKWFTKHAPRKLLNIKLENGRNLKVTETHKFYVLNNSKLIEKRAYSLIKGDRLIVPYNYDIPVNNLSLIDLENKFKDKDYIMVRHIKKYIKTKINKEGLNEFCGLFNIKNKSIYNYLNRNSFPIKLIDRVLKYYGDDWNDLPKNRKLGVKRNFIEFPIKVKIDENLMKIIGFYIAEGFCRKNLNQKGYYQVDFAINEDDLRINIKNLIFKIFRLKPNKVGNAKRLTYSSRLFYEFFVNILGAGHNAHTKRIPKIFLNLPVKHLADLLKAYFEGDGSCSLEDLRVTCDTVSKGLIYDLEFLFSRFGIYLKKYESEREPGKTVKEFYLRKNKDIPKFKSTKLIISSEFCKKFYENINFISRNKRFKLKYIINNIKASGLKIDYDTNYAYLKINEIKNLNEETTYCLNVPGHHNVIANGIVAKQCEGDENCIMLLLDALINFSRKYLPSHRGSTQDAPLVLTSVLIPSEVDDMVFDLDLVNKYPLELYEAALQYKWPNEIKIEQLKDRLGTEKQYYNFGFTHDVSDFNSGVRCSAYKSIPSMQEKVLGQMELAEKIRAVDEVNVAKLVIERHFIRDIRGNLRKFSTQQFRCVNCNEKYRRPPLSGECLKCKGRIIFTVAEGFIIKYLQPTLDLAEKFDLPPYLRQSLELTKQRIESMFGKDAEKQEGLGKWF